MKPVQPCAACLAAEPFNRYGSRTCRRAADWEVSGVRVGGYGFHVHGWNHSSGTTFHWGFHTYQIPSLLADPRFDFSALEGASSPLGK